MANIHAMQKVLLKSTEVLCQTLEPEDILRTLKTKEVLSRDDVQMIRRAPIDSEKVEGLLDILSRKPLAHYRTFTEVIKKARPDLYDKIRAIEIQYNFNPCKLSLLCSLDKCFR